MFLNKKQLLFPRSASKTNMKSYNGILVLEKAIRVLSCFDGDRTQWGVTELSRELKINKSTVSKILSTFENHHILAKNSENRKYRLGLRLFEFGSLVAEQMDLQKVAYPYMEELNRKAKETVHLVVMDDFEIVYINKVESSQSLRIVTRVGGRLPAYCTGVGKVLLAALPPEELDLFLKKNRLKKFTPNTITDREKLKEALARIRDQGYALDNEEFSQGLMCVAAPIFNYSQREIGAISISGPTHRIVEKNLEDLIPLVKSTAHQISRHLGYNEHGEERRRQ